MSIAALREALPPYAADVGRNLDAILDEPDIGDARKWGALLACAYALGEARLVRELEDAAPLDEPTREAVRRAVATASMTNVYYRALRLMKNPEYGTMPSRLRLDALSKPGADREDFEFWSMAVAAVNGCASCMDAHDDELRRHAVPSAQVVIALRIAAVVHGLAQVVRAEAGREG